MPKLYIPVESQSRELASRTAVALYSLENGFSEVILGRDVEVFNHTHNPGVVLLKSAASFESQLVDGLIARGNKVFSLDEEGILPPLNDSSINSRFSTNLLDKLTGVFVNGKLELASFPSWVKSSTKLSITGNPRFDFYAPIKRSFYKKNIAKISNIVKGKKIILLVSRFGDVNLTKQIDYFKLLEDNGYITSSETRAFHTGFYEHSKRIFNKFVELPFILAKEFPDHAIVIRPHPSECHEAWLSQSTSDNIIVNSEFDIASWLSCSEAMIHNGCTTSVEATAMGIPVISYVPEKSNEYDLIHANELGYIATSEEEIVQVLRENKIQPLADEKLAKLNEIIKYQPDLDASSEISMHLIAGAKLLQYDTIEPSKNRVQVAFLMKEAIKLTLSKLKIRACYSRKKFPYISTSNYSEIVENVSNCFGLGSYDVKRIGIDVFRITKNKR